MPGPTPLPVRLTDKQRAELLLLREDDNLNRAGILGDSLV